MSLIMDTLDKMVREKQKRPDIAATASEDKNRSLAGDPPSGADKPALKLEDVVNFETMREKMMPPRARPYQLRKPLYDAQEDRPLLRWRRGSALPVVLGVFMMLLAVFLTVAVLKIFSEKETVLFREGSVISSQGSLSSGTSELISENGALGDGSLGLKKPEGRSGASDLAASEAPTSSEKVSARVSAAKTGPPFYQSGVLQGIVADAQASYCLISGKVYREGDLWNGNKIISIEAKEVYLIDKVGDPFLLVME